MPEKVPQETSYKEQLMQDIVELEWDMFSTVSNVGGVASCQRKDDVFFVMRISQHDIWSEETLESYKADLMTAAQQQLNLMTFKYGYMMARTHPEEYEEIKDALPEIGEERQSLATSLALQHKQWTREMAERYPRLCAYGRPLDETAGYRGWPSVENYFFCELLTYSIPTLKLCVRDFEEAKKRSENPVMQILRSIAHYHGYERLEDIEHRLATQ